MSTIGRCIETGNRLVVAKGWGRMDRVAGGLLMGTVYCWGDEYVLELNRGNDCIIL